LITILLKLVVVEPFIVAEFTNTTVPELWLKAALLIQLPPTFIIAEGAVKVPLLIKILLKVVADDPDIDVVPANATVPVEHTKDPLFTQLPVTVKVRLDPSIIPSASIVTLFIVGLVSRTRSFEVPLASGMLILS